jgi:hypothetical protein
MSATKSIRTNPSTCICSSTEKPTVEYLIESYGIDNNDGGYFLLEVYLTFSTLFPPPYLF